MITKYTYNFDAPSKTRNFIDEATHALIANLFYSSLLLPSGSINYDVLLSPEKIELCSTFSSIKWMPNLKQHSTVLIPNLAHMP